jgi:PIN domain-containing protein
MAAKKRRYKKLFNTSEPYQKPRNDLTFFLDRSLGAGKKVAEVLRQGGLNVETHGTWFRHDTADEVWLTVVGYFDWIVLKRDKKIGKNAIEMDALLDAGVKSFVMASGQLKDVDNAAIFLRALPRIFEMVDTIDASFIAKVFRDSKVQLSRTKPLARKGRQKKRRRYNDPEIQKTIRRISALRETSEAIDLRAEKRDRQARG